LVRRPRRGRGPFDPFVTAETYHKPRRRRPHGRRRVALPGRQRDRFGEHSVGLLGVLPSIRLANLRRGSRTRAISRWRAARTAPQRRPSRALSCRASSPRRTRRGALVERARRAVLPGAPRASRATSSTARATRGRRGRGCASPRRGARPGLARGPRLRTSSASRPSCSSRSRPSRRARAVVGVRVVAKLDPHNPSTILGPD